MAIGGKTGHSAPEWCLRIAIGGETGHSAPEWCSLMVIGGKTGHSAPEWSTEGLVTGDGDHPFGLAEGGDDLVELFVVADRDLYLHIVFATALVVPLYHR